MAEYPFDSRRDIVGNKVRVDRFQEIPGGRVPARAKPTYFERHMAVPPLKSFFGEGLFAKRPSPNPSPKTPKFTEPLHHVATQRTLLEIMSGSNSPPNRSWKPASDSCLKSVPETRAMQFNAP